MQLPEITDETMKAGLLSTKAYCMIVLKKTDKFVRPAVDAIVWEHGRRNFALRAAGLMPIVCPVPGGVSIAGFCVLNTEQDEARRLMDDDPGIKAGIFEYEIHNIRSFPGDRLPG